MFGISPYTVVTEKQWAAMEEAGVNYVFMSIYEITYNCVKRLLNLWDTAYVYGMGKQWVKMLDIFVNEKPVYYFKELLVAMKVEAKYEASNVGFPFSG